MTWEQRVQTALQLQMPYGDRPERHLSEERRAKAIPAAVLILIGMEGETPSILYTKRTETVETHKGQIAFPGGHCEEDEMAAPEHAALRETEEEVGVPQNIIQVVGKLPELWTVTGYLIHPIVGFLKVPPREIQIRINQDEISEACWIPIQTLTQEGTYRSETIQVGSVHYPIHVYQVGDMRIWGATGSMTKNFLDRLGSLTV